MWRIALAGATALGLAAVGGPPALACDGCYAAHPSYGYERAYRKRAGFRFGFHEYYGFYDSGYKANPDGGFHSVVGPQRAYRAGKRRLPARNPRADAPAAPRK